MIQIQIQIPWLPSDPGFRKFIIFKIPIFYVLNKII